MTKSLCGSEIADKLKSKFAKGILESNEDCILVDSLSLPDIAVYLKDTDGFDFNFLDYITAVDYKDYFVLIYSLVSMQHNHSLTLKVRLSNRENASIPSLVGVWRGADFQEREIYDLFGIKFENHPNLKRIFLWDGFKGHPLRKDFCNDA